MELSLKICFFLFGVFFLQFCSSPKAQRNTNFTGAKTNAEITALSDDFATNRLSEWKILDRSKFSKLEVNTSSGKLIMSAAPGSYNYWFQNLEGAFLYRMVEGNFAVETKLRVSKKDSINTPPSGMFNSAGLLIRDPNSNSNNQNWVMLNIGYQQTSLGIETKNTENSSSLLEVLNNNSTENHLLICRINNKIHLYAKIQNSWKKLKTFTRNDFIPTLQVGLVLNTYGTPKNVQAIVDYIKFHPIKNQKELNNLLTN